MGMNKLWMQVLAAAGELQKIEDRLSKVKADLTLPSEQAKADIRKKIFDIRSQLYKVNHLIKESEITY